MFFKNIEGYHVEVSYKFAQCLDKYIVSFDTLKFKLTLFYFIVIIEIVLACSLVV